MKATLTPSGELLIEPDSTLEAYALAHWAGVNLVFDRQHVANAVPSWRFPALRVVTAGVQQQEAVALERSGK